MRLIDKDDAVQKIIKLAENLPEPLRSHTIFVALYLNNPNDFPNLRNCDRCKHLGKWEDEREYGYPSPCTTCMRIANDNYEEDKHETD